MSLPLHFLETLNGCINFFQLYGNKHGDVFEKVWKILVNNNWMVRNSCKPFWIASWAKNMNIKEMIINFDYFVNKDELLKYVCIHHATIVNHIRANFIRPQELSLNSFLQKTPLQQHFPMNLYSCFFLFYLYKDIYGNLFENVWRVLETMGWKVVNHQMIAIQFAKKRIKNINYFESNDELLKYTYDRNIICNTRAYLTNETILFDEYFEDNIECLVKTTHIKRIR